MAAPLRPAVVQEAAEQEPEWTRPRALPDSTGQLRWVSPLPARLTEMHRAEPSYLHESRREPRSGRLPGRLARHPVVHKQATQQASPAIPELPSAGPLNTPHVANAGEHSQHAAPKPAAGLPAAPVLATIQLTTALQNTPADRGDDDLFDDLLDDVLPPEGDDSALRENADEGVLEPLPLDSETEAPLPEVAPGEAADDLLPMLPDELDAVNPPAEDDILGDLLGDEPSLPEDDAFPPPSENESPTPAAPPTQRPETLPPATPPSTPPDVQSPSDRLSPPQPQRSGPARQLPRPGAEPPRLEFDPESVPQSGADDARRLRPLTPDEILDFNGRDCGAEIMALQSAWEQIRDRSIQSISLDITPSLEPNDTEEAAEVARQEMVSQVPSRTWRDAKGRVLATGKLVDYRNGMVVVQDDAGQRRQLSWYQLSNQDLCFVSAWWELPSEMTPVSRDYEVRNWTMTTFTWTASALCHKPLYFEEVQLERYGHSAGPAKQAVLSGVHFFGNIFFLPYHMGLNPPTECQYSLGYYRPGSCAPWMLPAVPLDARAARMQVGAIVSGLVWLP